MRSRRPSIIALCLIASVLITTGFGCKSPSRAVQERMQPITLEYWRVWDEEDAFAPLIAAYQQEHPNITIKYRKFRYEEYERQLLEAFAEDRGPDIFSLPVGWARRYEARITPMPAETTITYQRLKGTIKKEIVYELETSPTPNLRKIRDIFPDTVASDIVIKDQVYGLPLALDTLVLYYNKDLYNAAGLAEAPTTWETFQTAVQKLTRYDARGAIVQSGAAIGTGTNVAASPDLAAVIMMQNGARMTTDDGRVIFGGSTRDINPALQALSFYRDFADPTKNVYTWSKSQNNSLESFIAGKTAMMFGYSYHLPTIRTRAPRLNLGIAPIPQLSPSSPVNQANYWIETVAKKTAHPDEAWDFIIAMTTNPKRAQLYLDATSQPTALKSLIAQQQENEDLHASVSQVLTAKTWYRGRDPLAMETVFRDMLDRLVDATTDDEIGTIIRTAIEKINQTL